MLQFKHTYIYIYCSCIYTAILCVTTFLSRKDASTLPSASNGDGCTGGTGEDTTQKEGKGRGKGKGGKPNRNTRNTRKGEDLGSSGEVPKAKTAEQEAKSVPVRKKMSQNKLCMKMVILFCKVYTPYVSRRT